MIVYDYICIYVGFTYKHPTIGSFNGFVADCIGQVLKIGDYIDVTLISGQSIWA